MADLSNHFFKFIKPNSKFNVSIPRAFWEKLKETRCKKAILKRGRQEWPVDISDEAVFCDGWKEFVRDNEVQEFDFIVFKHQRNYVFNFAVFDQSMCERQYPSMSFDEMDVEEPLVESDANEGSKVFKKRKKNNNSSKNEDKFELDDDRSFTTIMTPYCIKGFRFHVPLKFVRSNGLFTGRRVTQVVLMDEAQRTFQATLETNNSNLRLVGWRELKIKNDLKVGDECTFKLIKHGKVPVLNVVIIRNKKPLENHMHLKKRKTISTTKRETRTMSANKNNHRSFISTLKPSSLTKSGLYIPAEFSIQNGLKLGKLVLRDDKGRSWNAELNKKGEKSFYVGPRGLKAFCYANGLKEGDTFKFELVENENDKPLVAKISLYVNVNSSPSEKEDHPYFIGEVKDYFIEKSMLHLPSTFVKKSGLFDKKEMILKNVKDDKSWTVKLKSNMKNHTSYISGQGWKDFRVANELKEGDLFKLELVSNGEQPIAIFYFLKICYS